MKELADDIFKTQNTKISIADTTGNPAPLGLLGFGLTTLLLNFHNAGFYPLDSMIMGMGIFVGGIAQVIAGVQEWKKNNTFGATAFTAYGFFWISLVAIWVLPAMGLSAKSAETDMGFFLALWGIFSAGMFVGTLRFNRALQVIFGSLTLLFALLAIRDFAGAPAVGIAAGWVGIFCGFSALYAAIAQVLNEVYGEVLLPLGPVAPRTK